MFGSLTPKYCFLTSGSGVHQDDLHAFESALRMAGVAHQNLVNVSSIFPPYCKLIDRKIGLKYLSPGDIRFCVKAELRDDEPNHSVGASVGLAIPKNPAQHGYLSEYEKVGWTKEQLGVHAEKKAEEFLDTIMDIRLDDSIVHTTNITETVIGNSEGFTTCVVAFAIFLFDHDIRRFDDQHPDGTSELE